MPIASLKTTAFFCVLAFFIGLAAATKVASWRMDAFKGQIEKQHADGLREALKLQKAQLEASHSVAVAAVLAERKIITQTQTIVQEVTRYVKNDVACPSIGFVRVLDAAALGADHTEQLPLPRGKSDEECAPVTFTALAQNIVGNYGVCRSNASQLDRVIEAVAVNNRLADVSPHPRE